MIDIRGLAYFVAQIDDITEWKRYAEDVLGMMTAPAPGNGLYVKMDERPFRILVVQGAERRYTASGWELANEPAFKAALAELDDKGVAYELADAATVAQRGMQAVAVLTDPSGNRHELCWGHLSDCQPFAFGDSRQTLLVTLKLIILDQEMLPLSF